MNHYTELLEYVKTLGESDSYVNTITQGEFDKIDLNKANIFPLLHVSINGAGFSNGSTIKFTVSLSCLSVRDKNNEVIDDKFWRQDNEVDNLNETLAVLNRIWATMYKDFEDNNITASEEPNLDIVIEERSNILDGWTLNFEAEMPNTTLNLCT